jgi:outer membrane lipoprotein SlyB
MALSSQILRMVGLPAAVVLLALSAGCSTAAKRPVFYPNSHIKQVGQAQARHDTDECMALADKYEVSRTKDGEVATRSVEGALIGGVSAGAWGIVRGDAGERAAAGALAGGSVGAVKGGVESTRISPTFQRFVQRCLREKGYDVIGWE